MDTKKGNNMTNMIQYDLTFTYARLRTESATKTAESATKTYESATVNRQLKARNRQPKRMNRQLWIGN